MKYTSPYGDIVIPLYQGNIGVACSGGADSSILLYALVLNGLLPTIFFIQASNAHIGVLQEVVAWVEDKCNVKLDIKEVPRYNGDHNLRPEIILLGDNVEHLYTGVTQNPTHMQLGPNRPTKKNEVGKFVMPFNSMDKRASIWLFDHLSAGELLDLSVTCTSGQLIACGVCYACRERKWAEEQVHDR